MKVRHLTHRWTRSAGSTACRSASWSARRAAFPTPSATCCCRRTSSFPSVSSRADLIEAMARGGKPKPEWRVGTEHEKHVYRKDPLTQVQYEGDDGIRALLEGIRRRTGWNYFYDHDNPIGLRNLTPVGGISL